MQAQNSRSATILGIMSGTSLDGLDLALCKFSHEKDQFQYEIAAADTISYSNDWKDLLGTANQLSAEKYFALHAEYGRYVADKVNQFVSKTQSRPIAIATHGHTVFHQPSLGFSTQLGCGATIAALTGITAVCDFRSLDVANGGQGAPLVPIGDKLLFGEYDACLNIGGIANVSFDNKGRRRAYDICVANMLLNYLSERTGKAFDEGGRLAASGRIDADLLEKWNSHGYFNQSGAKSLGREWFEQNMRSTIGSRNDIADLLATATEHVAFQIADDLNKNNISNVLVTGGGAFNSFLVSRINFYTQSVLEIPDKQLVNFKEALIFAFLGFLRLNGMVNALASVTGARADSVGGAVYAGR